MTMRRKAYAALLMACLCALGAAGGARAQEALPLTGAAAIDGQSLRLEDGTIVRLAGIVAPDPQAPAERPAADAARRALEAMIAGKGLRSPTPQRRDRHDRLLAHLYDSDGTWIQGALLQAGLVRVWTQPDAAEMAAEMLALEGRARAEGLGLWRLPYFAILTPDTAASGLDRFQIVEARVLEVARVRGTAYINTGPDWRSDFTARLERPALRLFAASGEDIAALKDRRIRVRGWLRHYNGPFLDVTHPQQIEVLEK